MKNYKILDSCFLTPQCDEHTLKNMLSRPGKYTQSDLEQSLCIDENVLAQALPLVVAKQLIVPQQVQEEIGNYLKLLNDKLSACEQVSSRCDFDLNSVIAYKNSFHEFHRRAKSASAQKMLTPAQISRADSYYDLFNTAITKVTGIVLTASDIVRTNRDTDKKIISLAFALAHDAPVDVLTRDLGITKSIRILQNYVAEKIQGELPRYSISTPLFGPLNETLRWQTPYGYSFAQAHRDSLKQNATSIGRTALSLFAKYRVG